MKKSVVTLSIIGAVLMALGFTMIFVSPYLMHPALYRAADVVSNLGTHLTALFTTPFQLASWVALGVAAVVLVVFIVHIIVVCSSKRPNGLIMAFLYLIFGALMFLCTMICLEKGYFPSYSGEGIITYEDKLGGLLAFILEGAQNQGLPFFWVILYGIYEAAILVGFILFFIADITDMVYLTQTPKPIAEGASANEVPSDSPAPWQQSQDGPRPSSSEIRRAMNQEMADQEKSIPHAEAEKEYKASSTQKMEQVPPAASPAIVGPLLVQYINTYSPAGSQVSDRKAGVPISEIQENVSGEKRLKEEDVRRIVEEALKGAKREEPASQQPLIVTVPAPAHDEAKEKPLTAEDVQKVVSEELKAYKEAEKSEDKDDGIVVEPVPEPSLSADDIRSIIRDEYAAQQEEAKKQEEAKEKARQVEEANRRALFLAEQEKLAEQKKAEEEAKAKEEAAKQETPSLSADDLRAIIAQELAKAEEERKQNQLTAEDVKKIVSEELASRAPAQEAKPAAPVTVIVHAPEAKKEEPQQAPALVAAPAKRVVGQVNPDLPPHDKIIRIPFPTRMLSADKELQDNYNELKSEILSYGVHSRVSNSGEAFRLHTVTFVKITIAGKSLKLYFALDPKDYANTPYPIQDASSKNIYKDIPMVFKVRSELSLRRAKELIADVMEKNGLEQGKVEKQDWVAPLKDYKPTGSADDED